MTSVKSIVSDKRDVAEIFRDRMGILIEERGDTLASFARTVGIDRSALSQFLAPGSSRLPRAETLHAIAGACGISLDWLLGLITNEETAAENAIILETIETRNGTDGELLTKWHQEAVGYKIRYIPSTLPDLLRTDDVARFEFEIQAGDRIAEKEKISRDLLTYTRRPETDMEVCLPLQRLETFARGEGRWKGLSREIRREQIRYMADLLTDLYPTFRLFLYDEGKISAAPYTIFGPKRAAVYLGNMYLVINSVSQIKALTSHFDNLIRMASVGPDRAPEHLRSLETPI